MTQTRSQTDNLRFLCCPGIRKPRGARQQHVQSAAINNTGATPIPDVGMVFMDYRSTPPWGSVTATGGALVLTKGGLMHLTTAFQTSGSTLSGKGWTITLAAGWTMHPGKRPGDFEIAKAGN